LKLARAKRLGRLLHGSAWRFLALTATDPALDRLYSALRHSHGSSLDRDPIPGFTFPALDFVRERIRPGCEVLEWGSGASTVWFHRQGCTITSIEHDPRWHKTVSAGVSPPSVVLLRGLGEEYVRPVPTITKFNMIVIDGRSRSDCAAFITSEVAAGRHSPGLVVVFDDSERAHYRGAVKSLASVARECEVFSGTSTVVLSKLTTVLTY